MVEPLGPELVAEGQVYRPVPEPFRQAGKARYRADPRRPKESPLWQCLCAHFYDFIHALVADGLFTGNGMFGACPAP